MYFLCKKNECRLPKYKVIFQWQCYHLLIIFCKSIPSISWIKQRKKIFIPSKYQIILQLIKKRVNKKTSRFNWRHKMFCLFQKYSKLLCTFETGVIQNWQKKITICPASKIQCHIKDVSIVFSIPFLIGQHAHSELKVSNRNKNRSNFFVPI